MRATTIAGEITLVATPMLTGLVSALASLSVIVSIMRSNVKLSTVYRRIVFGISAFDLIQSISQGFSSIPMTAGSVWGAFGNDTTCDIQGFTTVIGVTGSLLYSLALSIYFLCVIKFEMTEIKIGKCVEPFLHIGAISFSLSIAIYVYIRQWYNPVDYFCWAVPSELLECIERGGSSIACIEESKEDLDILKIIIASPVLFVLLMNLAAFAIIWYTEHTQSTLNRRRWASIPESGGRSLGASSRRTRTVRTTAAQMGPLALRLSRPSRASVRRQKEITNRAMAYISGFFMTFFFSCLLRGWELALPTPAPFVIHVLARFFYPLQGVFNLLIYTYPHTISHTRNNRHTYMQALVLVIKSGGDSDRRGRMRSTGTGNGTGRRRNTIRNEPVVTDVNSSGISPVYASRVLRQYLDSAA
jgi:hypothetical protein